MINVLYTWLWFVRLKLKLQDYVSFQIDEPLIFFSIRESRSQEKPGNTL